MAFEVKIIADSVAPCGKRLTTITATFPRIILAEVNTHRDRARNAASSRAIPFPKMLENIMADPFIPIRFGSEQRGMQTGGEVAETGLAQAIWLDARDVAIGYAQKLADLGIHKSICNRLVEPWMWCTQVMTATEWQNFFRLRCHADAEIHFQQIAGMIRDALAVNQPKELAAGQWHMPFVRPTDVQLIWDSFGELPEAETVEILQKCSVARCARVSYETHDGTPNAKKDVELYDRLVQGSGFGHWSPHEHVAMAEDTLVRSGPFIGWTQFRKLQPNENLEG